MKSCNSHMYKKKSSRTSSLKDKKKTKFKKILHVQRTDLIMLEYGKFLLNVITQNI